MSSERFTAEQRPRGVIVVRDRREPSLAHECDVDMACVAWFVRLMNTMDAIDATRRHYELATARAAEREHAASVCDAEVARAREVDRLDVADALEFCANAIRTRPRL